ncbi:MAG TPA: SRPBCC family protein [Opitutaceae bacterium]
MAERKNSPADDSAREILVTRIFHAPRELVFSAWTDPRHIANWWGPRGFSTTTHEMDVRPGGKWRLVMHGPDGTDYPNLITYREVVRPERLVYTHVGNTEKDPHTFVSTATFEELGGGKTRVTLRAVFQSPEERDFVVKTYDALEGARQTIERLGEEVATMGAESQPFVISREFAAPLDLLFKVWTDKAHLEKWWGPRGMKVLACTNDLRLGGVMHYCLQMPDGAKLWGKWHYRDIVTPHRLVFLSSFSNEAGEVVPHPMQKHWPREILTTVTFTERAGKTVVTVQWVPHEAPPEDRKAFEDNHPSMQGGWGGVYDGLGEYLGTLR